MILIKIVNLSNRDLNKLKTIIKNKIKTKYWINNKYMKIQIN